MERRLCRAIGYAVVTTCLAMNIAGCAYMNSPGGPAAARPAPASAVQGIPADVRSSDGVEGLVRYGALLHSLPAEAQEREYAQVAGALERNRNASDRIRMALLLSIPGASFRNDARARKYLEQVLDDRGHNTRQYRDLARLLLATLDDRKQLESELTDERRQRQELQQKLDQLKAIEQDTGTRIPPKPMKEH